MADRALITLTAGQRLVPLPFSYTPGTESLIVTLNGQFLTDEYVELSPTSIWLNDAAVDGELLEARNLPPVSY